MTTESVGRKPTNGNESKSTTTARKGVESSADDIQDDFRTLQEDVAKLTQQLAKLASAKGGDALDVARDNFDDVVSGAKAKGREMADAVGEVRDKFANAIEESLEQRPYTTLALVLAVGLVVGAMWKR